MFSSSSYAGWIKVVDHLNGDTDYVDYERIRKHDGYVYFWYMNDYSKPKPNGWLSTKIYKQGDCNLFRFKSLSWSFHKQPMGGGTGVTDNNPEKEWTYPTPLHVDEFILKQVCNR
jgi:hypothetical protein